MFSKLITYMGINSYASVKSLYRTSCSNMLHYASFTYIRFTGKYYTKIPYIPLHFVDHILYFYFNKYFHISI